jgi:hypothetical protein
MRASTRGAALSTCPLHVPLRFRASCPHLLVVLAHADPPFELITPILLDLAPRPCVLTTLLRARATTTTFPIHIGEGRWRQETHPLSPYEGNILHQFAICI